jgi:hypothetical protein
MNVEQFLAHSSAGVRHDIEVDHDGLSGELAGLHRALQTIEALRRIVSMLNPYDGGFEIGGMRPWLRICRNEFYIRLNLFSLSNMLCGRALTTISC